jgi:DNA mismatch repair ATPase MutS
MSELLHTRHPVQEQVVETFVPNDACLATSLDEDQTTSFLSSEADTGKGGTILLCTGANACGKVSCHDVIRYCFASDFVQDCLPEAGTR